MREVITERNLEAEWEETEAEEQWPSPAASSLEDNEGARVAGGQHAIPRMGEVGRADLTANIWDRRVPFYRQRLIGWRK